MDLKLKRVVMEVFGGCNYTCQMCPQSNPGRGSNFTRKMKLTEFNRILDEIVPKYGHPQINLEGSGEPTMAKDLPEYIKSVKKRNLKCFMYCNGARLNGQFMRDVIDAGIDFVRVSVIGYNSAKYKEWMNIDNFNLILKNLNDMISYVKESKSPTQISTYHLITDNNKINEEIELYKNNVISKVNSIGYIWKMHNWSGNYKNINPRSADKRRSCGRPFAPEITIRAGGKKGRSSAIVPCCQTLGPPNEEKSILGHMDKQSLEEIYNDIPYKTLRDAHEKDEYDKIDYCKNCDFLYEDPEVLVWSNDKTAKVHHMLGTDDDFILTKYNSTKS
jgi:MoaA/NifB/PqqE/SkfB family radical SAM enzyme